MCVVSVFLLCVYQRKYTVRDVLQLAPPGWNLRTMIRGDFRSEVKNSQSDNNSDVLSDRDLTVLSNVETDLRVDTELDSDRGLADDVIESHKTDINVFDSEASHKSIQSEEASRSMDSEGSSLMAVTDSAKDNDFLDISSSKEDIVNMPKFFTNNEIEDDLIKSKSLDEGKESQSVYLSNPEGKESHDFDDLGYPENIKLEDVKFGDSEIVIIGSERYVVDTSQPVELTMADGSESYTFKHKEWFKGPLTFASTLNTNLVINPADLCSVDAPLTHLVVVNSATDNFGYRQAIRMTHGKRDLIPDVTQRIVFLLGLNPDDTISRQIEAEAERHGDIIQGAFLDTYRNLTLKGVMGLRWVSEYCKNAKYIIKIDDDVILNTFSIVRNIFPQFSPSKDMMVCAVNSDSQIFRKMDAKWGVEDTEFVDLDVYPFKYCNGFFVVMNIELIPKLLAATSVVPYFWIDDVYLFGMLPDTIGDVEHNNVYIYTTNFHKGKHCFTFYAQKCPLLAVNNRDSVLDIHEVIRLWRRMVSTVPKGSGNMNNVFGVQHEETKQKSGIQAWQDEIRQKYNLNVIGGRSKDDG